MCNWGQHIGRYIKEMVCLTAILTNEDKTNKQRHELTSFPFASFTCVQWSLFQQPSQIRLHALLDDVQGTQLGGVSGQWSSIRRQNLMNPHHVFMVQPPGDFDLPQGVFHRHGIAHHQLFNGHTLSSALVHGWQHQACNTHAKRSKVNKMTTQVKAMEEEGGVLPGHDSSLWRSQIPSTSS